MAGEDQLLPFHDRASPLESTAMQNVVVGHDTESRALVPSTLTRVDQLPPSHESAFPAPSTAMQKLAVGQDMERMALLPSIFCPG